MRLRRRRRATPDWIAGGEQRPACAWCAHNLNALRRHNLDVQPPDGRDRLPSRAYLACGGCLETTFWVQPLAPPTDDEGPSGQALTAEAPDV